MATVTKTAGTIVSSTGWTGFTTTAIGSSNDTRATTASATYVAGIMRNFNFAVPGDESTIDGVTISVEFSTSNAAGTAYIRCRYSVNAGTNWSNYGTERTNATTTDGTQTNGGAADLMGLTPTQANVNDNTNFYVSVEGHNNGTRTCRVDYVTVTINYTAKYRLSCSVTDTAIATVDAGMSKGNTLATAVVDTAIAMQDLSSLKSTRLLTTSVTDWAITGQDLTSIKAARLLTTSVADYAIGAQDLTDLKASRSLPTSVTDWAIAAIDLTSLKATRLLSGSVSDWTVTAIDLSYLKSGRLLTASAEDWSVSMQDATLTYTQVSEQKLTTSVTDLAVTGQDTRLLFGRVLIQQGRDANWEIKGQIADLSHTRLVFYTIICNEVAIEVTPLDALLTYTKLLEYIISTDSSLISIISYPIGFKLFTGYEVLSGTSRINLLLAGTSGIKVELTGISEVREEVIAEEQDITELVGISKIKTLLTGISKISHGLCL
jgi:hypothetical protein